MKNEKKSWKFSFLLTIKKISIRSLNKHFFNINKHPKLQWLCTTTVSPGMGPQHHNWISLKKKSAGANSIRKQLGELFPHLEDDSLDLMATLNTQKDINEYLKKLGIGK